MKEIKDLIKERFVEYALKQSHAFDEGNSQKANKYHKKINLLFKQAQEQGCENVFKEFLDNKNENIELWAAGFCLEIDPIKAEKKLIKISTSSNPMMSISAKATLDIYRKKKGIDL